MKDLIFILLIGTTMLLFSGCGASSVAVVPFKVTGALVNVVAPDFVGDVFCGVGEVVEAVAF
jgi:hypothetical protein